jgi:outer membrane lipoprotein-sorting protein
MRFLFILCFLMASPPVFAADMLPETAAAESYLSGISTLKARFIQTANDGSQSSGAFLLKRPGRMKFEYNPPVTDFIVADGIFVYYYDGKMKQQSSAPIGQTLADFFLREKLSLSGDVTVSGVRREKGDLFMTLVQTNEPLAGSLTLIFNEKPMQLKKWRILDAQGFVTEVSLFDIETGLPLKSDLFHYYDPARREPIYEKN